MSSFLFCSSIFCSSLVTFCLSCSLADVKLDNFFSTSELPADDPSPPFSFLMTIFLAASRMSEARLSILTQLLEF